MIRLATIYIERNVDLDLVHLAIGFYFGTTITSR